MLINVYQRWILKSQSEGGAPLFAGEEMMQVLEKSSVEQLTQYVLVKYIDSQSEPGLLAIQKNEKKYCFEVVPETYQEFGYSGRIVLSSKVNSPILFASHQEKYGGKFIRTKAKGVLFGSFSQSLASMDCYYTVDNVNK